MINRESFAKEIQTIGEIAEGYSNEEFKRILEDLNLKKENFIVHLIFTGHFSAGKSALINTLIEKENFLLEDQLPQTSIATELNYNQDEKILGVTEEGTKRELAGWSEADNKIFSHIEVLVDAPKLKEIEDFTVVDTPGFDSGIENHNKALTSYLGKGSAYILVIDAEKGGIDDVSLPFLREVGQYSSQIAILLNKCDKQTQANIQKIKKSAEETLADYGLDYPVHCTSKYDENIGDKLVEIINGFSAQAAFDYQMRMGIVSGCNTMLNIIQILQKKAYLDTYSLDSEIHRYEEALSSLKDTFAVKRQQADTDYESAAENILNEVRASLMGKADAVAAAVLNGGNAAVNAILSEAIRPVLMRSFKQQAVIQVDDLMSAVDLSVFEKNEATVNLKEILSTICEDTKNLIENGSFEKLTNVLKSANDKQEEKEKDKSDEKKKGLDGKDMYHIITTLTALTTQVVAPWLEVVIVLLPDIVDLLKGIFGDDEKTKAKNQYVSTVIPQVMANLREPVEDAVEKSYKALIVLMETTLNEKIGAITQELENTKNKKKNAQFEFESMKEKYADDITKLSVLLAGREI